eukprot:GSA25T00017822001.1
MAVEPGDIKLKMKMDSDVQVRLNATTGLIETTPIPYIDEGDRGYLPNAYVQYGAKLNTDCRLIPGEQMVLGQAWALCSNQNRQQQLGWMAKPSGAPVNDTDFTCDFLLESKDSPGIWHACKGVPVPNADAQLTGMRIQERRKDIGSLGFSAFTKIVFTRDTRSSVLGKAPAMNLTTSMKGDTNPELQGKVSAGGDKEFAMGIQAGGEKRLDMDIELEGTTAGAVQLSASSTTTGGS